MEVVLFLASILFLLLLIGLVFWAMFGAIDRAATTGSVSLGIFDSRVRLAVLIGCTVAASVAYRLLVGYGLDQTAALFIGLPAVLALAAVFSPTPKSGIGVACKAVTIGLLIAVAFVWEGFLCIAMSAPLFFFVAILIGYGADRFRKRQSGRPPRIFSMLALFAFLPMSFEGVTPATSFRRAESVSDSRIIHASAQHVERALLAQPRFDRALPRYLRAGFPRPIQTAIGDVAAGSRWVIRFRGGETRLNGQEPADGDLVLELAGAQPGRISWRAVSDTSHMTHFLSWKEAIVGWEAVDAETTRVTWTLKYRRSLDPAWYFGPMERYAVRLAAGYLIETVATP